MKNKQYAMHVISGTHWDREWRYTAEQSLLRLAMLVDRVIDVLEKDKDYACFNLDGGTVILEDYIAVRPENKERLMNLMQKGRVYTVPWYTLPEMSTVSGESLIRNMLIGTRMGQEFGGLMKAGYTATSYGQISQLPQIYAGFGMDTAMTYRGTNKHQIPPIGMWQSPDGTQIYHIRAFDEVTRTNWFFYPHYKLVLGKDPRDLSTKWNPCDWPVHMADELFDTAIQLKNECFDFNTDVEMGKRAIERLAQQAMPQAIGHNLLALDMEDNASPYKNLPKLIKHLNSIQDSYIIKHTSLDDFVDIAKEAVSGKSLPIIKGEIRCGAVEVGFNGLLGATLSSRIPLKLMNDAAQVELINVAEPLSCLSSMLGGSYEKNLLYRAWLDLLKNHAHDSICGAAIDAAHLDNPTRFRTTISIAKECSRKAAEELWAKMDTQSAFNDGDITITFFNTLAFERKGVQQVVIDVPHIKFGDFVVEQSTGAGPIIEGFDPDQIATYEYFDIVDDAGSKIANKLLERQKTLIEVERQLDSNSATCEVVRNRILMEVDIPAMGYRTYALRPRKRSYVCDPKPGKDRPMIAGNGGTLENEYIQVNINSNGTFDMTDKQTGKVYSQMHYFCDNGSVGNAHQNKTPLRDYMITSLGSSADIALLENNALCGMWSIELTLNIPSFVSDDSANRSVHKLSMPIKTCISLKKGSKRLEVKTLVENKAKDHRLRLMFPTDIMTDYVYVSGPFDVLKRQVQWLVTGDNMEGHYPMSPMQDFVTVSDNQAGLSFLSKGLQEYEVIDDPQRTLAVTLIRTHRAYMLANRGPKTPDEENIQQGSHCLGTIEYNYAVYPHKGSWSTADVISQAQDFKTPYRVIQGVPKQGILPPAKSLINVQPSEHIHLSGLYMKDDGKGYILRIWNSSSENVHADIVTTLPVVSCYRARIDETIIEPISLVKDSLKIEIGHNKIETILLNCQN